MAAAMDADDARIDIATMFAAVWRRGFRIVLVTLLLLVLTYAVLLFVPKMYESSASLLVELRDSAFLRAGDDTSASRAGGVGDDAAVASQIQLIQSRDTLLTVIENANLRDEPELTSARPGLMGLVRGLLGAPAAPVNIDDRILARMSDRLTVIRERDSRIISILFRSESPELAARIANAIAQAHVTRRADLVISDTADATRWLEAEIDKMRSRVAEAESRVAAYRIDNDLYVSNEGGNSSLINQQLSDIATQITQSQERQSTANSRANVLRSLINSGQPIESVVAVRDSITIQQLAEEKTRLQSQRAERLATLLPNHPSVQALTAQVAEIDAQIVSEGRRIADALDAEARIEQSIESSLRDELARLKLDASGATTSGVTLAELEREAKAQRDLLETYLLRYRDASARSESNSALPDVRVVSTAAPAQEPASPKTALIMAAVLVVSIAGQVGLVLFSELASGRAVVPLGYRSDYMDEEPALEPRAEPDLAPQAAMPSIASQQPAEQKAATAHADTLAAMQPDETSDDELVEPVASGPVMEEARMTAAAAAAASALRPRDQFVPRPAPSKTASHKRTPIEKGVPDPVVPLMQAVQSGDERIVLISHLGDAEEAEHLCDAILADAIARGLSVATIDGASGRRSPNPGLTDLCAGVSGFGDAVHRDTSGQIARVPWGRQQRLDHRSSAAVTLAQALADIFDLVLITTGRPGLASSLPVFSGVEGYVLVASPFSIDDATFAGIEADAAALGFDRVQIVDAAEADEQVA